MRYLAGFIGGSIIATLLLFIQRDLVGGERDHVPQHAPNIALASVFESRPPERKPYEARQAPEKPEPLVKPDFTVSQPSPRPPRPIPLDAPGPAFIAGHGIGPAILAGDVTDGAAALTLPVEPVYPAHALRAGIEGEVEIEFTVLADGSVSDAEIIRARPNGIFEQSALRAVQRWQFKPKRENGKPVPMRVRQVIRSDLPGN